MKKKENMFGLKLISKKKYDELLRNQYDTYLDCSQIPNLFNFDGGIVQVGVTYCSPSAKLAWLKAMSRDFSLEVSLDELKQSELDGKSFYKFLCKNAGSVE